MPLAMTSTALAMIELWRRWWPTSTGTFAASAAAHSLMPASSVCATGFSTSVGTLAATHSSAWSTCS